MLLNRSISRLAVACAASLLAGSAWSSAAEDRERGRDSIQRNKLSIRCGDKRYWRIESRPLFAPQITTRLI